MAAQNAFKNTSPKLCLDYINTSLAKYFVGDERVRHIQESGYQCSTYIIIYVLHKIVFKDPLQIEFLSYLF